MRQDVYQKNGHTLTILNDRPSKGGAGRYARQLFEASNYFSELVTVNWDASEVNMDFSGRIFRPKVRNMSLTAGKFSNYARKLFPSVFMPEYYRYISAVKKLKKRVHYSSQLLFPVLADDKDIVSILDVIALDEFKKQPINNYLVKKFLKFNNILTISNVVAEQVKQFNSYAEPVTIHPYVSKAFHRINKTEAREYLKIPKEKKVILNVSSNQPRKNVELIKKVMDALDKSYLLMRVGPDIGIGLNYSNVSDDFLNLIYNAADFFLFPTLNEGFGYPLIEAMACGMPIITSDIPIMREVTNGAACLVDPTSVPEIIMAIRNLEHYHIDLVDKELLRARYFSFERFKSELLDYYETIGIFEE